jgi:hypothetical protein
MGSPRHPQVAEWLINLPTPPDASRRLPTPPDASRRLPTPPDASRAEVDEALSYLEEHGRGAALPDVRHRIQTSRHFPDMSEVRVTIDDEHVYRVLVGFGPND